MGLEEGMGRPSSSLPDRPSASSHTEPSPAEPIPTRDTAGRFIPGQQPPKRILPYTRYRLKKHEQRTMNTWVIGLEQARYGSPEQCEHHARYCIQQERIIRWANSADAATNAKAMTAIERAHVVLAEMHAIIAAGRGTEPAAEPSDLDRMLDS